jgi:iron complex outermembrane recepter protein
MIFNYARASSKIPNILLVSAICISPAVDAGSSDFGDGATLREDKITRHSIVIEEEELTDRSFYALTDLGRFIPALQTFVTGGGAGAGTYLRGIGASPLSAAFESSVPVVIDGVSLLPAAILQAGQVDVSAIEVIFGPQGVAYGRGATGGVIVLNSNDPGEKFEAELSASYLPEHKGAQVRGLLSIPMGSRFGARLAVSAREDEELRKNVVGAPSSTVDYRGRKSADARLTLLWDPTSDFRVRLKTFGSVTENDGPNWMAQMRCPEGEVQTTRVLSEGSFATPPPTWTCLADETVAFPDNQVLLPDPSYSTWPLWNSGVPYEEQEAGLVSLQLDWRIGDLFSIQSISAYAALNSDSMDVYDFAMGFGSAQYTHETSGWSQELRLKSHISHGLNLIAGAVYEDTSQDYRAGQNPMSYGLSASDLYTGNAYDWDRWQYTENQHWSIYARLGWDIGANIHLNAGIRYSDDERSSRITIPYINAWLQADDFPAQGTTLQQGLEFDGDELTPELVLSWRPRSALKLYAAYRSGYKAGGIDTSKMPYPGFGQLEPKAFLFDNETANGIELGTRLTTRTRFQLGITAHLLEHDDIQLQQFNSNTIKYASPKGGEAESQGLAIDFGWTSSRGNFGVTGALAYVDTEFTSEFRNVEGDSLKGSRVPRTPQTTGEFGLDYSVLFRGGWALKTRLNARYHSSYPLDEIRGSPHQDEFALYDATLKLSSPKGHYELSLSGLNLSDEVYGMSSMARPFACPGECFALTSPLTQFDQVITSAIGRQFIIRLTAKL